MIGAESCQTPVATTTVHSVKLITTTGILIGVFIYYYTHVHASKQFHPAHMHTEALTAYKLVFSIDLTIDMWELPNKLDVATSSIPSL